MRGNAFLHWVLYKLGFARASTETSLKEREALMQYVTNCKRIVEIGVYHGVTARSLRESMTTESILWCIDPFPKNVFGFSYSYSIAKQEINRVNKGKVFIIKKYSWEAIKNWSESLDFIFIDTDHTYDAVRKDWEQWSPHVICGGIVAFHDSKSIEGKEVPLGPIKLVSELKKEASAFTVIDEIETLTIFKKI